MPTFRMEQSLPPVYVTKALVSSLHAYIAKRMEALAPSPDEHEKILSGLRVSIADALGAESFASPDEFAPSKFPDSTREIEVEFRGPWDSSVAGLHIEVKLHADRMFSRLRISCEHTNARELARGLVEGINDCLAPHFKGGRWLHPPLVIDGLRWGVTGGAFGLFIINVATGLSWAAFGLGALLAALILYGFILPKVRPYTEFESRRAERLRGWSDWILKGVLGFLVFASVLGYFREKLLAALAGGG